MHQTEKHDGRFLNYALEEWDSDKPAALATVLHHSGYAYTHFEGSHLINKATINRVPFVVIGDSNIQSKLEVSRPNLFIPKNSGEVVRSLSTWLIGIIRRQTNRLNRP